MTHLENEELLEELSQLKENLLNAPYWVTGSVIETTRKQSNKEKAFFYLSQSIKGKTKTTYISASQLDVFKDAVNEGEKLKSILSRINEIHIQLIKNKGK